MDDVRGDFLGPPHGFVDSLRSTDIVEKCALLIRESLLETNFDLGDKFYDVNDLRQSWTKTPLPEVLLRFFGVLS